MNYRQHFSVKDFDAQNYKRNLVYKNDILYSKVISERESIIYHQYNVLTNYSTAFHHIKWCIFRRSTLQNLTRIKYLRVTFIGEHVCVRCFFSHKRFEHILTFFFTFEGISKTLTGAAADNSCFKKVYSYHKDFKKKIFLHDDIFIRFLS